jgi:hypothetical protein
VKRRLPGWAAFFDGVPDFDDLGGVSMGREAICTCDWAGEITEVKALLETGEIILRGGIRRRIPFSKIENVKASGDRLGFTVGGEPIELDLGPAAAKWAAAITSPPPTLARKLGITDETIVRVLGDCCDETLREALAEAAGIATGNATGNTTGNADLIAACVDSTESLHAVVREARAQLLKGVPIWMVYAKGAGHAINETSIRTLLREIGMIDTKVASVSAKYTALRFVYRKTE